MTQTRRRRKIVQHGHEEAQLARWLETGELPQSEQLRYADRFPTRPRDTERGWRLRLVWFVCVGWWLAGLVSFAGCISIATGLLGHEGQRLLAEVPALATLSRRAPNLFPALGAHYETEIPWQYPWQLRLCWTVFAGWWIVCYAALAVYVMLLVPPWTGNGLWLGSQLDRITTLRRRR